MRLQELLEMKQVSEADLFKLRGSIEEKLKTIRKSGNQGLDRQVQSIEDIIHRADSLRKQKKQIFLVYNVLFKAEQLANQTIGSIMIRRPKKLKMPIRRRF